MVEAAAAAAAITLLKRYTERARERERELVNAPRAQCYDSTAAAIAAAVAAF